MPLFGQHTDYPSILSCSFMQWSSSSDVRVNDVLPAMVNVHTLKSSTSMVYIHIPSDCIAEECRIVALLPLRGLVPGRVVDGVLVLAVPAGILATQIHRHEDAQAGAHGDHADQDGVALGEFRRVLGQVDESGDGAAEVTYINRTWSAT